MVDYYQLPGTVTEIGKLSAFEIAKRHLVPSEAKEQYCPICADVAKDPVEVIHKNHPDRKHIFCRECIQQWWIAPHAMVQQSLDIENTTCPNCREEIIDAGYDPLGQEYSKIVYTADLSIQELRLAFGQGIEQNRGSASLSHGLVVDWDRLQSRTVKCDAGCPECYSSAWRTQQTLHHEIGGIMWLFDRIDHFKPDVRAGFVRELALIMLGMEHLMDNTKLAESRAEEEKQKAVLVATIQQAAAPKTSQKHTDWAMKKEFQLANNRAESSSPGDAKARETAKQASAKRREHALAVQRQKDRRASKAKQEEAAIEREWEAWGADEIKVPKNSKRKSTQLDHILKKNKQKKNVMRNGGRSGQ